MAKRERDGTKAAARAWLKQETKRGGRAARPVMLLGLAGTAVAVGQAFCIATALGAALSGRGADLAALVGFAVLALLRACLAWMAERAAVAAGAASRRRLRNDVLGRLLHAGPATLRQRHSGDLTAIVVDRVEALDGLYARWIPASALAIAGPVLVALAALWADPVAALVLALCGLLVPVAMALAGIGAAAASRSQFLAMTRLQARFLDRVRGIATIVLYGRTEDETTALGRRGRRAAPADHAGAAGGVPVLGRARPRRRARARAARHPLWARDPGAPAGGAADGAVRAAAGARVLRPAAQLRAGLPGPAARHRRGRRDARPAAAPPDRAPAREVRTVAARGVAVAFEDVRLTWDKARGPALDGLSFRVPAGETLILAGPSGAGKSTVIEILLGFVRPDSGRVTLNGADIAELVPAALSRLTAWIGQRPVLFAGSIRDNIRFARPEATEAEIEEAARAARVSEFAALLPAGLDTAVGEGGFGLSGGQAQRVAIARAFLRNAPLLLLDEPTAHLDPATEADVLDSLRRLAIGRTVILASHSAAAHEFSGRRLDLRQGRAVATPARATA